MVNLLTPCRGCGATFEQGPRARNPRAWCSEACRVRAYRAAHPDRQAASAARAAERKKAAHVAPSYILVCPVCTETFTAANRSRTYCSTRCRNSASRERQKAAGTWAARRLTDENRRRARKAGADLGERFTSRDVLDRDGWVCQLCLVPINPELSHPDMWSASIDHIVPLARGGAHSLANSQASHLWCNSVKSDSLPPRQGDPHPVKGGLSHARTAAQENPLACA